MRRSTLLLPAAVTLLGLHSVGIAQRLPPLTMRAVTASEVREADAYVSQLQRSGELRLASVERDPAMPARMIERLEQFHAGVKIWDSEVVRDSESGLTRSIFGTLAPELTSSVAPALSVAQATDRMRGLATGDVSLLRPVELTICRLADDEYRLAYTAVVAGGGTVLRGFVDANTGAVLRQVSMIEKQSAVGTGRGVLGDTKKVSASSEAGAFYADDRLRPPALTTYDMRGIVTRAVSVVEHGGPLFAVDRAVDPDNTWEGVVVDAHTYVGWTYDYYFKLFGRQGLDNRNRPLVLLINGVTQAGALSLPAGLGDYAINAFWCGACGPGAVGLMYFGNGIPPGFYLTSTGQNIGFLAGSLDVVAHELTHGVTESSSGLVYQNESGALNEAFSDIMGTSVEFFYAAQGATTRPGDYVIGGDTVRGVVPGALNGVRSMADPGSFGDPDHFSRRYTGTEDEGGVHINATIATHAFYLAIEGGTNRTSGLSVRGVGAANRIQMEKVFYRAFVFLLPASATFSTARAATIQAARDLYGAGSTAERAVTDAWTAVGVL